MKSQPPGSSGGDKPRVLLVDDTRWNRAAIARELRLGCGIVVKERNNALEAMTLLEAEASSFCLVVSDYKMPGTDGGTFLDYVGERWPHLKRVLLTGYSTGELVSDSPYLVLDKGLPTKVIVKYICDLALP